MEKFTLLYYRILGYQPENLALLQEHFRVMTLEDPSQDTPEVLAKAQVVLAPLGYYLGREKIDLCPDLRVIGSNTTGHPHIDVDYAARRGIPVVTLKGEDAFLRTITPTAELTWGLIVALTRNLLPACRSVLRGEWNRRPYGGDRMLSRMALGVAGCGRLGSLVASYGRAFGMEVRYFDPHVRSQDLDIIPTETLTELVARSDIVSVHIPHEPETEGMFNTEVFARFKAGSFFVNTSRGELVDHAALLRALQEGRLAGAAMDVFEGEFVPGFESLIKEHPLWRYAREHDNLLITPHIGGSTRDAWQATEEFTIRRIIDVLDAYRR